MAYEDRFEIGYEPDQGHEPQDNEPQGSHDMSDDAEALASAGHGMDEDYGCYGDCNEEFWLFQGLGSAFHENPTFLFMQQQNEDNIDLLDSLDNQEFYDELTDLTEFAEQFSAFSPESKIAYADKMQMLTDIHSEVFGKPVPIEWNHNDMLDSKYTITYNVGAYNNE